MNEFLEHGLNQNRRKFLSKMSLGIGGLALGSLMVPGIFDAANEEELFANVLPHFAPKAKRVIYLFQNGAPSQLDLYDYKPMLQKMHGQELPASIRNGQRLTGMTADQAKFPLAGTKFNFAQHGANGGWFSESIPHIASMSDELCIIRSIYTEAINHDPALTFSKLVHKWETALAWVLG